MNRYPHGDDTAAKRMRRRREVRRRTFLQDGVLVIRFIKVLPPEPVYPPDEFAMKPPEDSGGYYTDSGENPAQWTPGSALCLQCGKMPAILNGVCLDCNRPWFEKPGGAA